MKFSYAWFWFGYSWPACSIGIQSVKMQCHWTATNRKLWSCLSKVNKLYGLCTDYLLIKKTTVQLRPLIEFYCHGKHQSALKTGQHGKPASNSIRCSSAKPDMSPEITFNIYTLPVLTVLPVCRERFLLVQVADRLKRTTCQLPWC